MQKITTAECEKRIIEIVAEQLGIKDVKPKSTFVDLGADSLDVAELTMQFEEEFDIDIPDEDVEDLKTINDVARYVAKKVAQ